MNAPQARRPVASDPRSPERESDLSEAPGWRTQERISRRRGLGFCVIEVHEFDVDRPTQRPPTIEYRVYADVRGFPVGEAVASFPTLEAAQRHAEALGARSSEEGG